MTRGVMYDIRVGVPRPWWYMGVQTVAAGSIRFNIKHKSKGSPVRRAF